MDDKQQNNKKIIILDNLINWTPEVSNRPVSNVTENLFRFFAVGIIVDDAEKSFAIDVANI